MASDTNKWLGGQGGSPTASIACYAAGTRIATPGHCVPVELLHVGDIVMVRHETEWLPRPVRWVGRFTVDLTRHPQPSVAAPIRVRADAVAPGAPCRDLLLSPNHALLLDGVLLPARTLLNGATITQDPPLGQVTYLHVELDRHGVLLAEGLPAESYLDIGNRGSFAGEPGVRSLHPDLASPRNRNEHACAPLVLEGPILAAAHARLLARAEALGWQRTTDPALQLLADDAPVPLVQLSSRLWRGRVPPGSRGLRLLSHSFVPDELDRSAGDRRRLGLAVAELRLGGRRLPARAFTSGWHAAVPGWRWTDGAAQLLLQPTPQARTVQIRLADMTPQYWQLDAETTRVRVG
jgi:hypothetical protein